MVLFAGPDFNFSIHVEDAVVEMSMIEEVVEMEMGVEG